MLLEKMAIHEKNIRGRSMSLMNTSASTSKEGQTAGADVFKREAYRGRDKLRTRVRQPFLP
jgi:hypothetical protein